jgi:hypothetical protein
MTDLITRLEAQGWRKEHEGGNCHSMRKGALVLTGFDGDLPDSNWFYVGLYGAPDDELPLWSESDASAEFPDINPPRDIWAAIREGEARAAALQHEQAQTIALEFAAMLRQEIGAHNFITMRARNALPDYVGACASHDFCDANMVMQSAWESVMGREFLPHDRPPSDDDVALWGYSWGIAKLAYLTTQ